MTTPQNRRWPLTLLAVTILIVMVTTGAVPMASSAAPAQPTVDKLIFFAADGLRQDLAQEYVAQGLMPTVAGMIKVGVQAGGGGLLTQAPPITGAGWYSLATGAWPGVTGSTNNTFAKNGAALSSRVGAFDTGVLQAETIAQAAEQVDALMLFMVAVSVAMSLLIAVLLVYFTVKYRRRPGHDGPGERDGRGVETAGTRAIKVELRCRIGLPRPARCRGGLGQIDMRIDGDSLRGGGHHGERKAEREQAGLHWLTPMIGSRNREAMAASRLFLFYQ